MDKNIKKLQLQVSFLKEGKRFVAYSPALDLSTSGKNLKEAKKHFEEIVDIFLEELVKMGTLEEVLLNLGWQKKDNNFIPPMIISQEMQSFNIPLAH